MADHIGKDRYRQRLAHAAWTWREEKVCPRFHGPSHHKDRASGRADKRAARQQDRIELALEADGDEVWNYRWGIDD